MNDTTRYATQAADQIDQLTERASVKAQDALAATKRATNGALDSLQDNLNTLRSDTPDALHRAAAQVDDLARRSLERARDVGADLRHRVERSGDRTVGYIQDQPVKSMVIALAAGAGLAALIGLLARSRTHHP